MKLNSNNLRVKTCKSSERKRRMTVTSVKCTNRLPERPKERKLSHLVVCQTNESEKCETETVISKNIELKSLWGECDEAIIHAIADRCKVLEENKLQNKLEFFYGSLGIKIDNIPSQPMKFENEGHKNATHQETEEFYKKKAQDNWGKLSKTIISKDCGKFRELIKTINSSTYPELKEYAKTIMSSEFQTIMTFLKEFPDVNNLDEKLKYARAGIESLNKILGIDDDLIYDSNHLNHKNSNKYHDESLINSLLLIKRSKLESIVQTIINFQEKSKKKSFHNLSTKIVCEISKKDLPVSKLAEINKKTKSKLSTKVLSSYSNNSKLSCIEESLSRSGSKKTKIRKGSRILSTLSQNLLNIPNEKNNCGSEAIKDEKFEEFDDNKSVSSVESFEAYKDEIDLDQDKSKIEISFF